MGSKAPPPPPLTLLPHSQYIFAVNILPKAGENPQPYSILQTVLKGYESQDFDKFLALFMFFLDAPFLALRLIDTFSK